MKIYVMNKFQVMKFILVFAILFSAVIGSKDYLIDVFQSVMNAGKLKPIYYVNTDKPDVALTFDVAWGIEDLDDILQILKDNNVKSTFFLTGFFVKKYPESVKKIYDEGHEIANHSQTHQHIMNLSQDAVIQEVTSCRDTIKELLGIETTLFRPPYGEYNNLIIEGIYKANHFPIQWDVDSLDWKEYGIAPLIKRVLDHKDLRNGSIILMHTGTKYTHMALSDVIKGLKEKGYNLVKVGDLIYKENYTVDHRGEQKLKE